MAKKSLRDAQENLDSAIDGVFWGNGTADDIKAARKALQKEWDNATPAERKQALKDAWGR